MAKQEVSYLVFLFVIITFALAVVVMM